MDSTVMIRGLYLLLGKPTEASDDDSNYGLQYCRGCTFRMIRESHSEIHSEEHEALLVIG